MKIFGYEKHKINITLNPPVYTVKLQVHNKLQSNNKGYPGRG